MTVSFYTLVQEIFLLLIAACAVKMTKNNSEVVSMLVYDVALSQLVSSCWFNFPNFQFCEPGMFSKYCYLIIDYCWTNTTLLLRNNQCTYQSLRCARKSVIYFF